MRRKIPVFKKRGLVLVFTGYLPVNVAHGILDDKVLPVGLRHDCDLEPPLPSHGNAENTEGSRKAIEVKNGFWGFIHEFSKRGTRNRKPSSCWKDQPTRTRWMEPRRRQRKKRQLEKRLAIAELSPVL